MTFRRKKSAYWQRNILITAVFTCAISILNTYTALAETGIKNVKLYISVEGFTEDGEPMIELVSQSDKYDVTESVFGGDYEESEAAAGPGRSKEAEAAAETGRGKEAEAAAEAGRGKEAETSGVSEIKTGTGSPALGEQSGTPVILPLPICEVEIAAGDGYFFSAMDQKDIQLNGLGGLCTKAVRKDSGSTLILTIQITGLNNITDEIKTAEFHSPGTAVWSAAAGASDYEVLLYKNSERQGQMHRTEGTSYDFSPIMSEPGSYHYKVYPVAMSGKRGRAVESPVCHINAQTAQTAGSVENGQNGSEKGYTYSDGLYPQSTWLEIEEAWYYFDEYGSIVTNRWQLWKNNPYYLDETGKMRKEEKTNSES